MRAISVTFCQDRQPTSAVAPRQPLPDDEWQALRDGTIAAMERHIPSPEDTEIREGHTVWDGREEYCVTISRIWATPTPEQMAELEAELATLAAAGDQAAVVLHDEQRKLVAAGKPTILDQLNTYTGGNIWQDVIHHLDLDEAATEELDPSCRNDRFVVDGQVYRFDAQRDRWHLDNV